MSQTVRERIFHDRLHNIFQEASVGVLAGFTAREAMEGGTEALALIIFMAALVKTSFILVSSMRNQDRSPDARTYAERFPLPRSTSTSAAAATTSGTDVREIYNYLAALRTGGMPLEPATIAEVSDEPTSPYALSAEQKRTIRIEAIRDRRTRRNPNRNL
jgi:hypothetical protein